MDTIAALTDNDRAARAFASRLRDELGVEHVYLFGSRATGRATTDSDYDFLIVGRHFNGVRQLERSYGLHDVYYAVGGAAALDLICLTPEEFESAKTRATLVR